MTEPAVSSEQNTVGLLLAGLCCLLASRAWADKNCSPEASYMVARAAECMEHEDAGCAKLKLDPILEKEPRCGGALFIRGWIFQYIDGQVANGRAMQERALTLDPALGDF